VSGDVVRLVLEGVGGWDDVDRATGGVACRVDAGNVPDGVRGGGVAEWVGAGVVGEEDPAVR